MRHSAAAAATGATVAEHDERHRWAVQALQGEAGGLRLCAVHLFLMPVCPAW